MLKPDGYVRVTYPDELNRKKDREVDTYQCGHCGAHRHLLPGQHPEWSCKICMNFICEQCARLLPQNGCRPQEELLLKMEGAIRRKLQWERNFREMG